MKFAQEPPVPEMRRPPSMRYATRPTAAIQHHFRHQTTKRAYVAFVQRSSMQHLGELISWVTAQRLFVAFAIALSCDPSSTAQPFIALASNATAYIAAYGGTLAPPGAVEIDGRRMACGQYPTVLNDDIRDFGESYPGFLVLNPRLFAGLARPVKLWIFSHECAHQTVGPDEVKADCVAVQRGRREGWLDQAGVDLICAFIKSAHGDQSHFTGTERCALMQACFKGQRTH